MSKSYTKSGDKGTSGLIAGARKSKAEAVFEALGTIDELSATLGLVHSLNNPKLKPIIIELQRDLFSLGSYVAGADFLPQDHNSMQTKLMRMEKSIDALDRENTPATSFVLPGVTPEACYLHLARVVARRLERVLVVYTEKNRVKDYPDILAYVNRLSSYLFVLARYYNQKGKKDIIWKK